MIPKIIHYCWLSDDPIPSDFQVFINGWKILMPDYEIKKWDKNAFNIHSVKWVEEAYLNKKYAFAADYIRLYALYNYGGIYLDMDVEVCKTFNPFLNLRTMLCWQRGFNMGLEVAVLGVEKGCEWIGKCLNAYNGRRFLLQDGSFDLQILPSRIEEELRAMNYSLVSVLNIKEAYNLQKADNTIPIFPYTYFSPKSYITGRIKRTGNTVAIHHFAGSWLPHSGTPLAKKIKNRLWNQTGFADLEIKRRLLYFIKFFKRT